MSHAANDSMKQKSTRKTASAPRVGSRRIVGHHVTMSKTVRFIPIKHGDKLDLGDIGIFGISGTTKYLGFKPGRSLKREGWLVVAEGEEDKPHKRVN